jgi:hypothetical protein
VIVGSAKTTDSGPFQELSTPNITQPTNAQQLDAHSSVRYRLLGAGGTSTEPTQDGIYLVSFQVDNTAASIAPSDEYFFVLHKNVPFSEVEAAVSATFPNAALVQVVPEPASASALLLPLALLATGRRVSRS